MIVNARDKHSYLIKKILSARYFILVPANNAVFLVGVSMIIGFTSSGANVCTGMLSDCIEYGDWKYGIREEGLTYSFMSFGVKLASALTGSIGVLLLAAVGYVAGADQTEATKMGINAIVNLLPALCVVVCTIPLFWYHLDKKKWIRFELIWMREMRQRTDKQISASVIRMDLYHSF